MRLRQALLNLASNANKFTEKGTITIAARQGQENVASAHYYRSFETLAPSLAMTPVYTPIRDVVEIEGVFQSLAREPNSGLVIAGDVVLEAPSKSAAKSMMSSCKGSISRLRNAVIRRWSS
jgi:signal transduction histidine kinase